MIINVQCISCLEVTVLNDLYTYKCSCGSEHFNELNNHECNPTETWWENDGQNIPLAKVCVLCKDAKLIEYRPEILTVYSQCDVDEPIEAEESIPNY